MALTASDAAATSCQAARPRPSSASPTEGSTAASCGGVAGGEAARPRTRTAQWSGMTGSACRPRRRSRQRIEARRCLATVSSLGVPDHNSSAAAASRVSERCCTFVGSAVSDQLEASPPRKAAGGAVGSCRL
eukprot:scaffold14591_cov140-Isochrysis_galbana.AAC.3